MSTQSPERPSRVEQEVREILERAEAQRSPVDQVSDAFHRKQQETRERLRRPTPSPRASRYLTPEIARILGALGLALVGALLSDVSRLLAVVAGLASLIVFFSLWFPMARPSSMQPQRWRGRDLR